MTLKNTEDFVYDGVDVRKAMQEEHGFLFIINDTRGRGLLGQEAQTSTVSGANGSRLIDVTFPEREIQIDYTLGADSLTGLREAENVLASLLIRESEKPLSFADQKGYFNAIFTGIDINLETDRVQQGTITFLCPNPFRYRDYVVAKEREPVEADTPVEIVVDTNYYTEAYIEIAPQVATGEIVLTVNDSVFEYEGDTVDLEKSLIIDGEEYECWVGEELKVLEVTGEFPLLKSNLNTITVNTACLLTIKYRERDI